MKIIDFTNFPKRRKAYTGANGNKISVIYEDKQYMLKFPAHARINKDLSYSNSCFSEYLGCKIYESVGVPVQEVLLGTYHLKGNNRIVVACRDFTEPGIVLQDFASLKNQMIDSERNGYGTDLEDILQTFQEQTSIDPVVLTQRFWDMFIVDALIGNWDRHNGNWGFLYNTTTDEIVLAPVFDCGSSLYPQADESIMENVLKNRKEQDYRVYEIPTSAITQNGKKIKYFEFISSLQNKDCNSALERIGAKLNLEKMYRMIDELPFASELQKDFYKTMLAARKEKIIDYSLKELRENEN